MLPINSEARRIVEIFERSFRKYPLIISLLEKEIISFKYAKTRTSIRINGSGNLDVPIDNSQKTLRDWIHYHLKTESSDSYELPLVWIEQANTSRPLIEFVSKSNFSKSLPIYDSNKHDSQNCKKVLRKDLIEASKSQIENLLNDWIVYFKNFFN